MEVESPTAFHWRMRRADWLTQLEGSETNLLVCNGPWRSLRRSLRRSRCAASADPAVSCEVSGSSISGQSRTGAMERSVAATAGEGVDIAGGVAVAVPTGSAW